MKVNFKPRTPRTEECAALQYPAIKTPRNKLPLGGGLCFESYRRICKNSIGLLKMTYPWGRVLQNTSKEGFTNTIPVAFNRTLLYRAAKANMRRKSISKAEHASKGTPKNYRGMQYMCSMI